MGWLIYLRQPEKLWSLEFLFLMEFLLLSVVGLVKDACSEATVVEEAVRDLEGGGLGLGKLKGPRPQKTGKPKQPQKPEPKPRKPQEPKPQQKKPQQEERRQKTKKPVQKPKNLLKP